MIPNYPFKADRLRLLRNKLHMTTKEVAEKAGMSLSAYIKIENGHSIPSVNTLFSLATLFCVSLDYLIGRSNNIDIDEYGRKYAEIRQECFEKYLKTKKEINWNDYDVAPAYPYNLVDIIFKEEFREILNDDRLAGLDYILSTLKERQRDIILSRFRDEESLGVIGKRLGITRERVRQIEAKSISILRRQKMYIKLGLKGMELEQKKRNYDDRIKDLLNKQREAEELQKIIGDINVPTINVPAKIEELNLSKRPYNALKRVGIKYVDEVNKKLADGSIRKIRNMGVKNLEEVEEKINNFYG